MIANVCVCVCAFHFRQRWISKKRKKVPSNQSQTYIKCERADSLTSSLLSIISSVKMVFREIIWLECLWTRLTSSPHSIQTCDVSSALTSRGRGLSLQPPLSTLISSAYSALLSNFLLKACLPGNVNHSDSFFFLGLCNTLIYTVPLFSHGLLCVKDALYF